MWILIADGHVARALRTLPPGFLAEAKGRSRITGGAGSRGTGGVRKRVRNGVIPAAVLLACVLAGCGEPGLPPLRVGGLHSLTGTMALSERPVCDGTLLAIEEINDSGGVLGRPLEAVVVDGQSDWPTFARQAGRLISGEGVAVALGCWTSASGGTAR